MCLAAPLLRSAGYGGDQLSRVSRFDKAKNFTECQQYVWMEDGSVGCRVPYVRGSRFHTMLTKLLWANVSIEEHHELRSMGNSYYGSSLTTSFALLFFYASVTLYLTHLCSEDEPAHQPFTGKAGQQPRAVVILEFQHDC